MIYVHVYDYGNTNHYLCIVQSIIAYTVRSFWIIYVNFISNERQVTNLLWKYLEDNIYVTNGDGFFNKLLHSHGNQECLSFCWIAFWVMWCWLNQENSHEEWKDASFILYYIPLYRWCHLTKTVMFCYYLERIYPIEYKINDTTYTVKFVSYID